MKDFQVISRLGEGSYSSVWKVKRISDGQEYAMKKVKMSALSDKEKENALNEVRILASIKSPWIIGYKEAFFEDNSMTLCIVMEYAAGGDIYNKITTHKKNRTYFKEDEIWTYAIQMIMGLKALHDMKILHRDLKCANVFISKDGKTVKLGDLNVSKVAKNNLVYTQTGTPYYASPEVWRDQPYDLKSDIWSLGCVLYEIAALKPPFTANDMQGLYKKVQRGVFDRIPPQYSVDLYNLISMCLQVSPSMRPTCDQLLKHPIIIKHGKGILPEELDELTESHELLGTIKLPKNIRAIGQALPKPNYTPETQSLEIEKGKMPKAPENERNISSGNGKRAISQMVPLSNNAPIKHVLPQSRESKIAYMQKIVPALNKETEKEYLARLQREFIDNAKAIKPSELAKHKSPKIDDNLLARPPSYKALHDRKSPENLVKKTEAVNGRPEQKKYYDYLSNHNKSPTPDISKNANYVNVNPYQIRPSNSRGQPVIIDAREQIRPLNSREQNRPVYSREQIRPIASREKSRGDPIGHIGNVQKPIYGPSINKQEYIINKYHQDANRPNLDKYDSKVIDNQKNYQRIYNEDNNVLNRRADYLLQKYQQANEKNPVNPVSKPSPSIQNPQKDVESIIKNYNNIYNLKQQYDQVQYGRVQNPSPYQKVDYNYHGQAKLGVQNKNIFSNENVNQGVQGNVIRNNHQMQQRGVTRPVWWG